MCVCGVCVFFMYVLFFIIVSMSVRMFHFPTTFLLFYWRSHMHKKFSPVILFNGTVLGYFFLFLYILTFICSSIS